MAEPAQKPGRSKQDYRTPDNFLEAVRRRFGPLAWDLASDGMNSVADLAGHLPPTEHCFMPETDALARDWWEPDTDLKGGWLWLNPPFGEISKWAAKCAEESERGARILFLVPAAIGANWFRDHVHGRAYVLGLNGRLCFDGKNPYPKDLMLCVYGSGVGPGFDVWNWRE